MKIFLAVLITIIVVVGIFYFIGTNQHMDMESKWHASVL
jgi:hypothetical protein